MSDNISETEILANVLRHAKAVVYLHKTGRHNAFVRAMEKLGRAVDFLKAKEPGGEGGRR